MEPGSRIADRFTIERLAGRGGMGSVYRAHDATTDRTVAIKILRDSGGLDERRFVREAQLLAELDHPGIVRYVDHGATREGRLYLVMEWLEGRDLGERLRAGALAPEDAVAVAHRVALALSHAHRRGVIHRDIKPSNLFLPDDDLDRVKLIDFGVAHDPRGDARLTRTGAMIGSLGYMSPEQARGDRELDARADVYSLGAVVFRAIVGEEPFTGQDDLAVMIKTMFEEAPRLTAFDPSLSQELDDLVARMLSKTPAGRPRDGTEVADALAGIEGAVSVRSTDGRPRRPSLGRDERVVRCLAIARIVGRTSREELTVGEDDLSARDRALVASIERLGATLERLPDGSAIATVRPTGSAGDAAAAAARCGLALRAMLPESSVAVVAQRTDSSSTGRRGSFIDRALAMVEHASREIEVDEVVAALLGPRFELVRSPKGIVLLAERDVDDVSTSLLGRPHACVGRTRELSWLEGILHESIEESVSRVVLVTAAAGIGKSRLRYELTRVAARDGRARVLVGRADPMRSGSPFALIVSALSGLANPIDNEFVRELLGTPASDPSPRLRAARSDPMVMSAQVQRALLELFAREVASAPMLLVLEDVHWGDVASVTLVEAALRELRELPFMVLAVARPEVSDTFPRLFGNLDVQHLRLSELTRSAAERLVRDALGDAVTAETTARIVARAGGNALYLEELVRSVAEGKGDTLPDTMLAIVQARLETFDAEPRRVLRAASIFGRTFRRAGVAALLGGERRIERVDAALERLLEREVILTHGDEHVFRHDIVREAAYAMLTDGDRDLGHSLAAEWLLASGKVDPVVVAEHFERADKPERAIAQYERAAEEAIAGNAIEATIERAEKGVSCGASGAQLGALRLLQGEAYLWAGNPAAADRCATEALGLVPRGSREWFLAVAGIFIAMTQLGRHTRLLPLVAAMSSVEPSPDAASGFAKAAWIVGVGLYSVGIYEVANRLTERLRAIVSGSSARDPLMEGRLDLMSSQRALFARGDPWGRLRCSRRAMELFDEAGDRASRTFAAVDAAHARVRLGERAAIADLESLGGVVDEHNKSFPLLLANAFLADAWWTFEEHERAEEAARKSIAELGYAINSPLRAMVRVIRARASIALGRLEEAEREVRETLDEVPPSVLARADTVTGWAQVMLARGKASEALAAAKEAKSIVDGLSSIGYSNELVLLVHARALHATGDRRGALAAITKAEARLLGVARAIDDPDLRRSFLENVPQNRETLALARAWKG